ncbi:MAG: hypothetical protein O7G30_13565 [Proteobacteria bacterium]|nr:hypothetical protein [Pseudomonadota bacterium]
MARVLCLAIVVALFLPGCITRTVTDDFYDHAGIYVFFRYQQKSGRPISRGYQHPAVISKERLAHILSVIDVKTREGQSEERRPAVEATILYPIAEVLSTAFAKATPAQEIAVVMARKKRRLGLFHRKYLTSFIAWIQDDSLYLDFSRVEWEVPKQKEAELPMPRVGDKAMPFRVVPGRAMHSVGPQTVAVAWREPIFSSPFGQRADGVVRRTVLMDSPIPAAELEEEGLPPGLRPEDLRELADLEEARQNGEITESYYQRRRESIIQGEATTSP